MPHPSWGDDWSVSVRVWVERAGRAILGKGRLELLESIERWHSIREAAQRMNMSYRRAWLLVQNINESAGTPLVVAATGGAGGGGARLTPLGKKAVSVFREVQNELQRAASTLLPRLVRAPDAPVLHLAAAVSLEEVVGRLLADYALRQPAVSVRTIFGASDELADHILAGAAIDLFLTADVQHLARLETAGLVKKGARRVLADNTLAAIAPGEGTLRLRKPGDLLRRGIARVALARDTVPLGTYTRAYLERLDLYDELLPRVVFMDNSRAVVNAIKAGQADAGIVYGSDAARAPDCRLLFHISKPPQPIRYVSAVLARCKYAKESTALCAFLGSPQAAESWRQCGFTPCPARKQRRSADTKLRGTSGAKQRAW